MEQKYHGSPLSRICYQDSTYMLETLLPFVPPNMKLPLAIMIKWSEFQRILKVFQNPALLHEYGLFESEFSMEKYACQLADCPNKKLADSISQMERMMQMMQMMQVMNDMKDMPDINVMNGMPDVNAMNSAPDVNAMNNVPDIGSLFDMPDYANAGTDASFSETKLLDASSPDPLEDFDIDQFVKEIFS